MYYMLVYTTYGSLIFVIHVYSNNFYVTTRTRLPMSQDRDQILLLLLLKFYIRFFFFFTCSNYTCISLVKHYSTSVLLQLGSSHICECIHIRTICISTHMWQSQKTQCFKCFVLQQRQDYEVAISVYICITIIK